MEVEPLHAGHAEQQSEQKALPKQHAIDEPKEPMQRPMFEGTDLKALKEASHVLMSVTEVTQQPCINE